MNITHWGQLPAGSKIGTRPCVPIEWPEKKAKNPRLKLSDDAVCDIFRCKGVQSNHATADQFQVIVGTVNAIWRRAYRVEALEAQGL